jgi:hypothetical protein
MSNGEGTIAGSHVELHLKTGAPNFQFSPDGKVLQGSMQRASGTRPSMWQYLSLIVSEVSSRTSYPNQAAPRFAPMSKV